MCITTLKINTPRKRRVCKLLIHICVVVWELHLPLADGTAAAVAAALYGDTPPTALGVSVRTPTLLYSTSMSDEERFANYL